MHNVGTENEYKAFKCSSNLNLYQHKTKNVVQPLNSYNQENSIRKNMGCGRSPPHCRKIWFE